MLVFYVVCGFVTDAWGASYDPVALQQYLDTELSTDALLEEAAPPKGAVWFAEVDGAVAGFSLIGKCILPHADVTAEAWEVHRYDNLAPPHARGREESMGESVS